MRRRRAPCWHDIPRRPAREGRFTPDRDPYRQRVTRRLARIVGGLRAGGVGLRAGDPATPPAPTMSTCCTYCLLRQGQVVAETLEHFVVQCPHHNDRRRVWRKAFLGGAPGEVWQPREWLNAALDFSAEQQGGAAGRRATLEFWRAAWAATVNA